PWLIWPSGFSRISGLPSYSIFATSWMLARLASTNPGKLDGWSENFAPLSTTAVPSGRWHLPHFCAMNELHTFCSKNVRVVWHSDESPPEPEQETPMEPAVSASSATPPMCRALAAERDHRRRLWCMGATSSWCCDVRYAFRGKETRSEIGYHGTNDAV